MCEQADLRIIKARLYPAALAGETFRLGVPSMERAGLEDAIQSL